MSLIDMTRIQSNQDDWPDLADELADVLLKQANRDDINDFLAQFIGELTGWDPAWDMDSGLWSQLVADRLTERALKHQPHYRTRQRLGS